MRLSRRGQRLPAQDRRACAPGGGLRTVVAGEALLAPTITRRLIEDYLRQQRPDARANEIAAQTSTSRRTVERQLLRAQRHLRDLRARRGETEAPQS
jgi:hypothetical protein